MKNLIKILSGMAIIAGIILTIQAISVPQSLLQENVDLSETYQVLRKDITEKTLVTGKVISSEDIIDLSFDREGIVKNIFNKEGDRVELNDILMIIEDTDLGVRKNQALAQIESAQVNLDKVLSSGAEMRKPNQAAILNAQNNLAIVRNLAGSNIRLAENQVSLTQAEVSAANKNFNEIQAQIDSFSGLIGIDYENIINETYFTLDNSIWFLNRMQEKYFHRNDQISFKIKEKESETLKSYYSARWYYETYLDSEDPVDWIIREMPKKISEALKETEETYRMLLTSFDEDPLYQNILTDDDSDKIDETREEINSARSKINQISNNQSESANNLQALLNLAQERKGNAQASLLNAEQNLTNIKQESQNLINRAENLLRRAYDQVIISFKPADASDIERAKQRLIQTQSNYNQLLKEPSMKEIVSPIEGIIKKININVGDLLQKNINVFKINISDNFNIEAELKHGDTKTIDLLDEVIIKSADFPQKIWQGSVSKIGEEGIIINFDNCAKNETKCFKLKKDTIVNLEIVTKGKKNALVIPKEYLIKENDKNLVKMKVDGERAFQEVRIGIVNGEFIEILQGVEESDTIYLP
jgi:multidrug efflux pump subunit AcrA (membrane-fusion protein)